MCCGDETLHRQLRSDLAVRKQCCRTAVIWLYQWCCPEMRWAGELRRELSTRLLHRGVGALPVSTGLRHGYMAVLRRAGLQAEAGTVKEAAADAKCCYVLTGGNAMV